MVKVLLLSSKVEDRPHKPRPMPLPSVPALPTVAPSMIHSLFWIVAEVTAVLRMPPPLQFTVAEEAETP